MSPFQSLNETIRDLGISNCKNESEILALKNKKIQYMSKKV